MQTIISPTLKNNITHKLIKIIFWKLTFKIKELTRSRNVANLLYGQFLLYWPLVYTMCLSVKTTETNDPVVRIIDSSLPDN